MIPDIINLIPKLFKDDAKAIALADNIQSNFDAWKESTLGLKRFVRADEVPAEYLEELNYMLSARFTTGDTEMVKRKKIFYAIESHKQRSTWENDAKLLIDSITGYSADIYNARTIEYSGLYTVDNVVGTNPVGTVNIQYIVMAIDCHPGINVSTLTADQIAAIIEAYTNDVLPAYYSVSIGYFDTQGYFVEYYTFE